MNGRLPPDHQSRAIPDQAIENLLVLWVFTVVWNAAAAVVVTPLVGQALKTHDYAKLLALAFPAVGLGLLAWAGLRSWRAWRFGESVLHLENGYAAIGGELVGVIHVQRPVRSDRPVRLRLVCLRRVHHTGPRVTTTTERVLWQKRQDVEQVFIGGGGTDIPVGFAIPADAAPSSGFDASQEILWRLEARRGCAGVSYWARFEVPVRAEAPEEVAAASPGPGPVRPVGGYASRALTTQPGITYEPLRGGLHIHLAAARRKPWAPTLAGLILTGAAAALVFAPAPGLVRIITLAVAGVALLLGALFDYIALYLWLVSQDVTVRAGTLGVRSRAFFIHWRKAFAAGDIVEVACKTDGGSTHRDGSGQVTETTSYGIQIRTRDGRRVWIANGIADGGYAGWLTDEISRALGLTAETG